MKIIGLVNMLIILFVSGCRIQMTSFDLTPPAIPRGLQTFSGDDFVEVFWEENTERDLAGYNVYTGQDLRGAFKLVGSTREASFIDRSVVNGRTYYYAVTAFDFDGNESDLSVDAVGATSRPEGLDVTLFDYRRRPDEAGYDFSTYSVGLYNDNYTDIFFEYTNGIAYMDVWDDTDIQDMGYTSSLDEIRTAPADGWAPTKDVRLIRGHTYVVWTWDNRFAKFRVVAISSERAVFDWAYQLMEGNPFLKRSYEPSAERGPLRRSQDRAK